MMTVRCLLVLLALLPWGPFAPVVMAADVVAGGLQIIDARITETPPHAASAAGYVTVVNTGATADRLLSVQAPGLQTMIHRSSTDASGVTSMEMLMGGLDIPAGSTVLMEPGALHIMFTGLTEGLSPGQSVPATLTFESAGAVAVDFVVTPRPSAP